MTDQGPEWSDLRDGPDQASTGHEARTSAEPERPRRKVDPWTIVIGLIGGALVGTGVTLAVLGFAGVFEEPTPPTQPPAPTLTLPPPTTVPNISLVTGSAADVAQRAIPSIVAVEVSTLLGEAAGSGVVYSSDGYLITNHHVIDGASEVAVVFADGGRWPAEIVGSDRLTDIAVLRIERKDLTPIDIGTSAQLAIGQSAVAVGNPLALEGGPSVTAGIVSALDRSLTLEAGTMLYGLVQTDAPITRGSSGGALLDASSRLIGITTAIAVSDVGAEGLGFAIPIDLVIGVANDLIGNGEVNHALLGISGRTALAEQEGAQYPVGVIVDDLLNDSAYEAAGGQINDVITALDGKPVTTLDRLLTLLRSHRAGQSVDVAVTRADQELALAVTLGKLES
jgi:putative serine protease PepD